MNDKTNLAEKGLCEWINAYLRDEIDAEVFANLEILNHLCTGDISDDLRSAIFIVMGYMVSKKPFTPQDRKKVKEKLKKAVEIYNQSDKTDKTEEIEPLIDEIDKIVRGENATL